MEQCVSFLVVLIDPELQLFVLPLLTHDFIYQSLESFDFTISFQTMEVVRRPVKHRVLHDRFQIFWKHPECSFLPNALASKDAEAL
jgi:hypothetical protein